MAMIGVNLKIDVTKIDKDRLFKGEKGTYLDAVAFINTKDLDKYGNSGMIVQQVSKEEKDQGVQGAILGNSKVFWTGESNKGNQSDQQQQNFDSIAGSSVSNDDDNFGDIPF